MSSLTSKEQELIWAKASRHQDELENREDTKRNHLKDYIVADELAIVLGKSDERNNGALATISMIEFDALYESHGEETTLIELAEDVKDKTYSTYAAPVLITIGVRGR
ncbi:hypothetical protein C8R48DRAFT_677592 [Suillus tomentosus]|nr:hypothetical protein C8R48DRAFT_677592 [Suillus tomentosus]